MEGERRIEGARVLEGIEDGGNVLGASGAGASSAAGPSSDGKSRRSRVKGPNPLSQRKKKVKVDSSVAGMKRKGEDGEDDVDGGDEVRKKKKRKRRGKGEVAMAIEEIKGGGLTDV